MLAYHSCNSIETLLVSNSLKAIRYGVVANISRSHNLRDQFRGAQGSIPCTGVSFFSFCPRYLLKRFVFLLLFLTWSVLFAIERVQFTLRIHRLCGRCHACWDKSHLFLQTMLQCIIHRKSLALGNLMQKIQISMGGYICQSFLSLLERGVLYSRWYETWVRVALHIWLAAGQHISFKMYGWSQRRSTCTSKSNRHNGSQYLGPIDNTESSRTGAGWQSWSNTYS